jgi:hypothetical protein
VFFDFLTRLKCGPISPAAGKMKRKPLSLVSGNIEEVLPLAHRIQDYEPAPATILEVVDVDHRDSPLGNVRADLSRYVA